MGPRSTPPLRTLARAPSPCGSALTKPPPRIEQGSPPTSPPPTYTRALEWRRHDPPPPPATPQTHSLPDSFTRKEPPVDRPSLCSRFVPAVLPPESPSPSPLFVRLAGRVGRPRSSPATRRWSATPLSDVDEPPYERQASTAPSADVSRETDVSPADHQLLCASAAAYDSPPILSASLDPLSAAQPSSAPLGARIVADPLEEALRSLKSGAPVACTSSPVAAPRPALPRMPRPPTEAHETSFSPLSGAASRRGAGSSEEMLPLRRSVEGIDLSNFPSRSLRDSTTGELRPSVQSRLLRKDRKGSPEDGQT